MTDSFDAPRCWGASKFIPRTIWNWPWPGANFAAALVAQYAGAERYNEVLGLKPGTSSRAVSRSMPRAGRLPESAR